MSDVQEQYAEYRNDTTSKDPGSGVRAKAADHGHEYSHAHGHESGHEKGHEHHHGHSHSHTQTKVVIHRLSRAIGHLEAVKRMVENGRDCPEVLIQLAAVESAINNTAKIILKDHIEHCLADAFEQGDQVALDELNEAIDRFIK